MSHDYDLVVIGSGPAGEKGAAQAAWYGKRVALVERDRPGGACVHTGTLPSKSLRESALQLSGMRTRAIDGLVEMPSGQVPVARFLAHKDRVVAQTEAQVADNLARHDVEVIHGHATLGGPHRVHVGERVLDTAFVLIATGSRPFRPDHLPFDGTHVYDSDDVLQLDLLPTTLLVVGAGVIGCEYATMFAALGTRVTLLEKRDRLLSYVDQDILDELLRGMDDLGIDLRHGVGVASMTVQGDAVRTTMDDGSSLTTERVLFAAGRSGNTENLGLDTVGLSADRRGRLSVDEQYRTGVSSIFAAGDVIGFPALASASMDQGRLAVCHMFGFDYRSGGLAHHIPMGIYTIPELSMVGASEQELRTAGADIEIGVATYDQTPRGRINGGSGGRLKLVFDAADKRLRGVHIVGENAAELVHIGAMALQLDATIDVFVETVFNHPTLSEVYKYAAYDGLGRLAARTSLEHS